MSISTTFMTTLAQYKMALVLLIFSGNCLAQNQQIEVRSASGKLLMTIQQEYLGKKPPPDMYKIAQDPEKVDIDFYRVTYKSVSGSPIKLIAFSLGLRFGAGTLHGVKSEQAEDSFGSGLKALDLTKQGMFEQNVLPANYIKSYNHWLTAGRGINYMDREMTVEQNGVQTKITWSMKCQKGIAARA